MSDYQGEKELLGRTLYKELKAMELANKKIDDEYHITIDTGNYVAELNIYDKYTYLTGKKN